jgi:predicted permease
MAASIVPEMPESAGTRLAAGAHQWARISLALMVIGPSILLIYAWVEVLNNPAISLADRYWVGRTPYTPIGIVLSLPSSGGAPPWGSSPSRDSTARIRSASPTACRSSPRCSC